MTTFGRIFRKIFFASIVLFFIGGVSYSLYQKYYPTLPSCSDNIMNQGETGVDCGVVCQIECPPAPPPDDVMPITVDWSKAISGDIETYDLVAKITNPNKSWGIADATYKFIVRDSDSIVILEQTGDFYVLPDGYDYVIIPARNISSFPAIVEFDILEEGQKWARLNEDYDNLTLALPFREKIYSARDENGFPSASAILKNATNYDFDKIDVKVVLYNDRNEPIAANISDRRTMRTDEEQKFHLVFGAEPKDRVVGIDFKATTNIFDSQNFMTRFGTGKGGGEYR